MSREGRKEVMIKGDRISGLFHPNILQYEFPFIEGHFPLNHDWARWAPKSAVVNTWMSGWKLGSMVCKWVIITPTKTPCISRL